MEGTTYICIMHKRVMILLYTQCLFCETTDNRVLGLTHCFPLLSLVVQDRELELCSDLGLHATDQDQVEGDVVSALVVQPSRVDSQTPVSERRRGEGEAARLRGGATILTEGLSKHLFHIITRAQTCYTFTGGKEIEQIYLQKTFPSILITRA